MVKRLLALLLFCSSAFATTNITGNLKNLGGGSISFGTFVRFYLRGCSGNQPRINGTAIIGPTLGNIYYIDLVPTAAGAISGTVYSTTDATGTGNGDIECGGIKTGLWYGMQPFINGKAGVETPIAAKNTATIDISNITPLTANPVVLAPTGDTTYARLDGGNQPFTGDVQAKSLQNVKSVVGYGALNNCTTLPQASNSFATCAATATDNSTFFQNAVNAACGSNDIPEVDIPASAAGHYYLSTAITIGCDGLKIHGLGLPLLYCPNGCFTNSGHRNVELYNIWMWGNETASVYAYSTTTNAASALNNHLHDLIIYNFGTGGASGSAPGTGGGIGILSDSQKFNIDHSFLSNCTADISIQAATDTADLSGNTFGDSTGTFTCKGRALDVVSCSGANTIRFNHNNITKEGFGSIRSGSGNTCPLEIVSTEVETSQTISNASNASVELIGNAGVNMMFSTVNPHTATGATFGVFVGNSVANSSFSYNTVQGYNTDAFSVGTGSGNIFFGNVPTAGYSTLYSGDYVGIVNAALPGGAGWSFGCSNATLVTGDEFCTPTVEDFASGTASTNNFIGFTPSLANGNSANLLLGTANSTNNAAFCAFNNVSGAGSANNTMTCGVVNGSVMTITPTGLVKAPGGILSGVSGTGLVQTGQVQNGANPALNIPTAGSAIQGVIASGTKALNTSSITTATCDAGVAATANGTVSTDAVQWSFNAAPTTANKYGSFLVVYAVPSTNTVTFYTCNPSATTSTPTAMSVNWAVTR